MSWGEVFNSGDQQHWTSDSPIAIRLNEIVSDKKMGNFNLFVSFFINFLLFWRLFGEFPWNTGVCCWCPCWCFSCCWLVSTISGILAIADLPSAVTSVMFLLSLLLLLNVLVVSSLLSLLAGVPAECCCLLHCLFWRSYCWSVMTFMIMLFSLLLLSSLILTAFLLLLASILCW